MYSSMGDITVLVTGIEKKIDKLTELYIKTKEENSKLTEDNQELLKKVITQEEQIKELIEQNKLLQIAKSIKTAEGKTEIKLRINELVREIDNCIALLNR